MAPTVRRFTNSNVSTPLIKNAHRVNKVWHGGREKVISKAIELMNERVDWIDAARRRSEEVGPFLVADIGETYRNYARWTEALPDVEPHFAMKSNPEDVLLRLLASAGSSFDCASLAEVKQVRAVGVDPSRIIFAHPRACVEEIEEVSSDLGVKTIVFDSEGDLENAVEYYPDVKLVIRFKPDDSACKVKLGEKFGAPLTKVPYLLQMAKDLGLDVIGASFHIGSDSEDPRAFSRAIKQAREVFDVAQNLGFEFSILDLGGGYTRELFDDMAATIRGAIDYYFPRPRNIRIIGEPGRFFVASAFVLAARVNGRVEVERPLHFDDELPDWKVDLSDGLYGSLANLVSDHQSRDPKILRKKDPRTIDVNYLFWGPTCDSWDKPNAFVTLPGLLNKKDWLYFEDMGAYTIPCATNFNGYSKPRIVWTSTEPEAADLLDPESKALLQYPSISAHL